MRTRSTVFSDFSYDSRRMYELRSCSGPWVTTYGPYTPTGVRHVKTITDVEVPNFQALKKCGGFLPLNPVTIDNVVTQLFPVAWDHIRMNKSCNPLKVTDRSTGGGGLDFVATISPPEVSETILTAAVNGAIAEARESAWDVLTFLAEFSETVELFKSAVERVRKFARLSVADAIRAYKKFHKSQRRVTTLRELFSQYWLEYRYGWLPAILDLESAINAFQKHVPPIARGRSTIPVPFSLTKVTPGQNSDVTWTDTETLVGSHTVRGWAAAEIKLEALARFGVDPLLTAWEKVPFSFVVDWFVQVGTWIQATSPFAAGRTLGSCVSIKTEYVYTVSRNLTAIDNATSFGSGSFSGVMKTVSRNRYERYAREGGLPGWNPVLNWKRTLDAIALVGGLNRDILRRLRV